MNQRFGAKVVGGWAVVVLAVACGMGQSRRAATNQSYTPGGATPPRSAVADERDVLFMLAAMSFTYAGLDSSAGYDISAVIAWNVEDETATPTFVIDRNRNNEFQGDIHHAEINTLRDAYRKRWDYHVAPGAPADKRRAAYADALAAATLYTTLEPCPMCQTTITMAKVPRAVFCMEDPGLRSATTHETTIVIPTEFYGRKLTIDHSTIPECGRANVAMWKAVEGQTAPARFSVTTYIAQNGRAIFAPGWQALACWTPLPANAGLLAELRKATGVGACPLFHSHG